MLLIFQLVDFAFNRMTISDYNTKPVRGDHAILFLKLHGSLEITRVHLKLHGFT